MRTIGIVFFMIAVTLTWAVANEWIGITFELNRFPFCVCTRTPPTWSIWARKDDGMNLSTYLRPCNSKQPPYNVITNVCSERKEGDAELVPERFMQRRTIAWNFLDGGRSSLPYTPPYHNLDDSWFRCLLGNDLFKSKTLPNQQSIVGTHLWILLRESKFGRPY